jgi:hypothetical protein
MNSKQLLNNFLHLNEIGIYRTTVTRAAHIGLTHKKLLVNERRTLWALCSACSLRSRACCPPNFPQLWRTSLNHNLCCPMSMQCATSSLILTSPHLHDNDLRCDVCTPLSIGQPMAALRQSWVAKGDRLTFDQRVIDTTLVIETLRPLVYLIPRHER